MKLACAGWGFREMPLETYFRVAVNLGIEYVEVNCQAEVPLHLHEDTDESRIEEIKRAAQDLHVKIVALAPGSDFTLRDQKKLKQEISRVNRIIDLGEKLNVEIIRLFAGWIEEDQIVDATYRQVSHCFNEVGRYAEGKGIHLAMENHGGVTANVERTQRILQGISSPAVGLNYDPANFVHSGEDPLKALKALRDHIAYVHLKDYRSKDGGGFCALGEGEISWAPIFKELDGFYDGYCAIEYEKTQDIIEGTKRSIVFLEGFE